MQANYIDTSSFWVEGDHTDAFVEDRKIRAYCDEDGYKYSTVESSDYDEAQDRTTVTIVDDVLTGNLLDVLYGIVSPQSMPEHNHDDLYDRSSDVTLKAKKAAIIFG